MSHRIKDRGDDMDKRYRYIPIKGGWIPLDSPCNRAETEEELKKIFTKCDDICNRVKNTTKEDRKNLETEAKKAEKDLRRFWVRYDKVVREDLGMPIIGRLSKKQSNKILEEEKELWREYFKADSKLKKVFPEVSIIDND